MTIEEKTNYKIVRPKEGYLLTVYDDSQSLEEYDAFSFVCIPLNCKTVYKEISLEEDKEYKAKQNKYYEELSKRTDSSES